MGNTGIAVSIITAWILAIGLSLPVILSRIVAKKSAKKKVMAKIKNLSSSISELDSRLQIVRSHAIDYSNTIGSDGAKRMSEIQSTLSNIQLVVEKTKSLLETNSIKKISIAERILDGRETILLEDSGSGNGKSWEFKITDKWKSEIEEKLQVMGAIVASASSSAKNAGIPTFGRQFKRETIHDLKEAGIDLNEFINSKVSQ